MSELTERAKQVTALYFRVVLGTMFIFAILLSLELMANFQGLLWIPGVCFIAILLFQQIVKNSPPILIFSGTMSLYTAIPFVGDLSIGKTFTDLHEKVKKMIDNVCTMLALASLFLFVIYIDSDYSTQIEIAFYFFMGFTILAWWSAKTESESKLIWKPVLVAGVLVALKGTALLYPMAIHETLGIYPGIRVDKSTIKASTKVVAQQDATVKNSRNVATISEFEKITTRLKLKTSAEIIRDRQTLLDMNIITPTELRTIEAEARRRANSPVKKAIKGIKSIQLFHSMKLVKTITYSPGQVGLGGMVIKAPAGKFKVKCSGYITQLFTGGKKLYRSKPIHCMANTESMRIYPQNLRKMPVQEARGYGRIVINGSYPQEYYTNVDKLHINVNIPQTYSEYEDILGSITIQVYQ